MNDRAILRSALSHPNVQAFARTVRAGESRQDDRAYFMRYGGAGQAPKYFEDLSAHPHIFERTPGGQVSSASGAFQATFTTWEEERLRWGFPDFSPASQDEFFVSRLIYRQALEDVKAGRFWEACRKCSTEWTSLPGGKEENAATRRALETYLEWGGKLAEEDTLATEHYGEEVTESTIRPIPPAEEQEAHMAPVILPLLQIAAQFLPQIAEKFGSGSEVANRNLAAGKVLADAIVTATNSPNLQAAVEKMAVEPEAVKAANAAVAEVWPQIFEAGGGGIDGARKAAADPGQIPPSKNPAVWFMGAFVPLIYGTAYLVLTGDFSQDARMMVVTAIFTGLLASGTAFFLGSSLGSQRKTSMIQAKE